MLLPHPQAAPNCSPNKAVRPPDLSVRLAAQIVSFISFFLLLFFGY
uniref:Uncharacterized protein n=1 Tax=Rhizophora mucronata TaxID=61149 RepID=A0A2P2QL69_RHIMU